MHLHEGFARGKYTKALSAIVRCFLILNVQVQHVIATKDTRHPNTVLFTVFGVSTMIVVLQLSVQYNNSPISSTAVLQLNNCRRVRTVAYSSAGYGFGMVIPSRLRRCIN